MCGCVDPRFASLDFFNLNLSLDKKNESQLKGSYVRKYVTGYLRYSNQVRQRGISIYTLNL